MLRPYILIFLLFNLSFVTAQTVTFNKVIGIEGQDVQGTISIETDTGYIFYCNGSIPINFSLQENSLKFIHTDKNGDSTKIVSFQDSIPYFSIGSSNNRSFKKLSVGGYGLLGSRTDGSSDPSIAFIRFNNRFEAVDYKIYNNSSYREFGRDFLETSDGGYFIIGGRVDPNNPSFISSSYYFIKTDSVGNKEWEKTHYLSEINIGPVGIYNAYDGGYIISGSLEDQQNFVSSLIKVDTLGDIIWEKKLNTQNQNYNPDFILSRHDSSYVVAYPVENGVDTFGRRLLYTEIKKLDKEGNEIWTTTVNDKFSHVPTFLTEVAPAKGYIVSGEAAAELKDTSNSTYYSKVSYLLRIDNNGNVLWERRHSRFPNYQNRYTYCIINSVKPTHDGGFICTGLTSDINMHLWMLKLDSLGCWNGYCGLTDASCYYLPYTECGVTGISSAIESIDIEVNIYPNPASDQIKVEFEKFTENSKFSLYNIKGKRVLKTELNSNISKVDVSQIPSGHYFYTIENQGKQFQKGRLVILE